MSLKHSRRNAQVETGKALFSSTLIILMIVSFFGFLYSPIPLVHASTSWTSHVDDFETGSTAAFWNVSQGTAYVVGLSWDLAYGGRYGCESVYGTEAQWFYDLTATGTLWFSFMFKIATEPDNPPATSTTVKLFSINYTDGGTGWFSNNISIVTGSSPTPQFRIIGNDAAYDEGNHTIYKHTWYFVKVSSAISGTTITTTLYVDNAVDCSVTKTGLPSGTWQHSRFYLHGVKWSTGTNTRLDDFGESTTEPTLPYFATVGVRTTALWVDSFSATEHQWTNNAGSSPYLSVVDYAYATNTLIDLCTYWPLNESWFGFQDLPADSLSIVSVYAFQVTFSATYGVWNWAYWKNSSSSYQEGFFYSTWLSGWQLLPAKDSGGQGAVININHTYPTVAEVNSATFRMSDWRTNNNQNGVAVDGMFLMVTYTYEPEPTPVYLTVSSYPEINALFTMNGSSYSSPQIFLNASSSPDTYVLDATESYHACKWTFNNWVLNGTISIFENPWTITVTANSTMTMIYSEYDPTFGSDYTTINVDGNITATPTLNHAYYWNPHSMNTVGGTLVLADLNSWSIDYSEGYVHMLLDSNSTDAGHIATGTWWNTWNISTVARQPLANSTYVLSFDINIVNVTYEPTSWLRIALAVAWCDPTNETGWVVKYVERDLYDNPIALNHTEGNAGHDGNIVFRGNDVIEYKYETIVLDSWRHYDWNISQYIEAGWGNISSDARLESAYVVIEVENVTHSEVKLNNLWLKVTNSSTASPLNSWDSRVTRAAGDQAQVRWVTAWRNGTDGYGVYADVRGNEWYDTDTHLVFADDNQDAYWNVITNGTSSLSAEVDSSFKMNGTESLKINGTRGSATDECYIKYPFLGASPLRIWTDYDFFVFFIYFNESDLYFHRFQAIDNESRLMEWPIKDCFNNITSSGWNMITLPIRTPTYGNCTSFNYANVSELRFWPDKAFENLTEVYGKPFTVWMDLEYLDKATTAYVTFNAPFNAGANITVYGKKEITGWDGQYLPIISSSYSSNGSNYQLLRPTWFPNWAPRNSFSTDLDETVPFGYSEFAREYSGATASVIGGESVSAVIVNGSSMGGYKKLVLRLKLAPLRSNYTLNSINGDVRQLYTYGDMAEVKIMVYYQTDMAFDIVNFTSNFEGCGNWVFVNEKYYSFNLTLGATTDGYALDSMQMRFSTLTREGYIVNTFTYAENWTVAFSPENTSMEPTRLADGIILFQDELTIYTFKIYFTSECSDIWKDDCVDVDLHLNSTGGYSTGWLAIASDMFKIYSLGGFVTNTTIIGDAGLMDTGTAFSMWGHNDSYIYRSFIYRDLVHIKLLPEISAIIAKQTFDVSYGIDYCLNGYDWVQGWELKLSADSVTVGSILYFNWTVRWYNRGVFVSEQVIRSFHHTGFPRGYDDSYYRSYTTTASLWVDLWFDRQNGSAVGGGRVNAYEYPMKDNVPVWLSLFASDWGPVEDVPIRSMQLFPILDGDDITPIPSSQIKMVRVWESVQVFGAATDQEVIVSDFHVWDLSFSNPFPPLTGIQTPYFDETIYPSLPTGGLLGAMISSMTGLFKWLGENILYGGLRMWPLLTAFLDTIAAWMGFPGGFSAIMAWLEPGWVWLVASFTYMSELVVQLFLFLGSVMGYLIVLLTEAVAQFANIIDTMAGFFQGSYGTGMNIWNDFGLSTWLTLGLIFYPVYLFYLWDTEGMDAVMNQLMFIFNVLSMLAHYFISVIQMILNGIHTLVEAIPVVE